MMKAIISDCTCMMLPCNVSLWQFQIFSHAAFTTELIRLIIEQKNVHPWVLQLTPFIYYVMTVVITEAFGLPQPSLFCN